MGLGGSNLKNCAKFQNAQKEEEGGEERKIIPNIVDNSVRRNKGSAPTPLGPNFVMTFSPSKLHGIIVYLQTK